MNFTLWYTTDFQVFIHGEMKMKYRIEAWSNSLWNVFDLMSFVVFAVAVVLRFVLDSEDFFYARFAYSISLGVFILRTLQLFYISRHIGPKVVMLEKLVCQKITLHKKYTKIIISQLIHRKWLPVCGGSYLFWLDGLMNVGHTKVVFKFCF